MPQTLSLASYLDSYGHTLTLVNYLAQELSSHPQLKEIPLLGDAGGLTISSDTAWEVVLTYLRDNNLPSNYLELLENPRLARQKKLEVILDFLQNQESELPLANLAIEKNLAAYQASLEAKTEALNSSDPLQKAFAIRRAQIKKYHESLHVLQGVVVGTTAAEQLAKRAELAPLLPPPEILTDQELALVQEKLVALLPSLASASVLSSSPAPETIYKTLSEFATKDPALSKFVVFNSSVEQKSLLANFVTSSSEKYQQLTHEPLVKLEQAQRSITNQALSPIAIPRITSERMFINILVDRGLMPIETATALATQLYTESVRSAYTLNKSVSSEDLISSALTRLSLSPDSSQAKALSEALSPLFADLLSHNQTQILEARRLGYVPGAVKLPQFLLPTEVKLAISTNTDPALLSINPQSSLKELLKQHSAKDPEALRELALRNNNTPLLIELSFLENYKTQLDRFKSTLKPSQQLSVGLIRAKQALSRGVVSYQKITTKGWDKLLNFQEKLDHFNPIIRVTNWWVDTEAKIMDTGWGWALNPVKKAVDTFYSWRDKTVSNILKKYKANPPKTRGGRFINWAASMYYQGGFTVGGFTLQTAKWAASTIYHKVIVKAAKKLGAFIAKKAVGLAIKILGQAVVDQIANVVPGLGVAIAIIGAAFEVIKTIWQNRQLVADLIKKGAVYVAAIGFAIWSFLVALFAKIGSAILGSIMGAAIGFVVGGPVGALFGGIIGGVAGFLATNIAAVIASAASYASAMMSALAAAGSQIAIMGAGILGVTYFTALTIITTTTTAEIPAPNTYAIFPPGTIECSLEKTPIQSGFEPSSSYAIASRGWEIVSDLYQGFWCYWNRSPGDLPDTDVTTYPPAYPELFNLDLFLKEPNIDPSVASAHYDILFWCTWLIQKSYNETGNGSLSMVLGAASMQADFMARNKFIPNRSATSDNIVPGTVVFFQVHQGHAGTNHVALVTKVNEDAIYYIQSNGSVKEGTLSFSSSGVAGPSWADIPGFGSP